MKNTIRLFALSLALMAFVLQARADRKYYVWTYQNQTMHAGEIELEDNSTFYTLDMNQMQGNTGWEHQLELDMDVSSRLGVAVYNVFYQIPGEDLKYKGFKLRANYQLATNNRWPLDATVLLEYQRWTTLNQNTVECRLILDRHFGRWNVAINPAVELEKEPQKDEWEFKPSYAVAGSYHLGSAWWAGLEAQGEEGGHYLGPVLAFNQQDFWIALGSGFRVSEKEAGQPDFQVRLLLGLGLWEGK
jgi:hypothetical protein